jgi:MFS family permease
MNLQSLRRRFVHLLHPDDATRSQWAYIAAAAVEHSVILTTSGAFLTLLIKQMNVSDALTGIISSFTTLALGMQLFSVVFIRRRRSIRSSVLWMQTGQQLLYCLLFLLPFLPLPQAIKPALCAVLLLVAATLNNLIIPVKFNWLNSFVQQGRRGIFTAHREMVSLFTGLVYNFLMSRAVDHFAAVGRPDIGLKLCALFMFIFTVCHAGALAAAKDAPAVLEEIRRNPPLLPAIRDHLTNPVFFRVLLFAIGWNFFSNFFTTYQTVFMLQEVSASATYIAVAGIVGSLVRILVSPAMGKYSDKHGFAKGCGLGLCFAAASYIILGFWQPGNGKLLYMLSTIINSIGLAAVFGGMVNLLFEYVESRDRVSAMSVYCSLAGLGAFIGSLAGGAVLDAIQKAGNRFLGLSVYGQQVLAVIATLGLLATVLYGKFVLEKTPRITEQK